MDTDCACNGVVICRSKGLGVSGCIRRRIRTIGQLMAKRRYDFDEKKLERFMKEGRGQGHGESYRPWLTIQDVSSSGRSSRIHCRKTGREHHFLSDIKTALFLLLDWSDSVTDIREQFPLDREETRRIAADMGVRHPRASD